jgi:hypothetical protein
MSRPSFSSGKRDANEAQILELLDRRNIRYLQLHPGDGADLIVEIHPMIFVEIKNPEQPPSKRQLTEAEEEQRAYCTAARIPYHVIETPEQMAEIINQYFERL